MSKSKLTTPICICVIIAMLITTTAFMNGERFGLIPAHTEPPYTSLFTTDRVHSIDIVINQADWQGMLDNASAEEYVMCNIVIDGVSVKNAAIRPKGNSSLSSVSRSDSDRYSFKVEFDHYNSAQTYMGLDKLVLNNIIQDNTFLKDYVSYQLMDSFGAYAPLCSFVNITLNGEDWGLYLAVEAIEESYAQRVFGNNYGQIYKPDNMDMNATGNFNLPEGFVMPENGEFPEGFTRPDGEFAIDFGELPDGFAFPDGGFPGGFVFPEGELPGDFPQDGELPDAFIPPANGGTPADAPSADSTPPSEAPNSSQRPGGGENARNPQGGGQWAQGGADNSQGSQSAPMRPGAEESADGEGNAIIRNPNRGGGMGGRNSEDIALKYSDDSIDSYPSIFGNAAFKPTDADKKRLIASIKQLNEGENIDEVVNIDEVLRYFVVHNYLLNFDSYTGSMLHNYYLHENDGVMSMIAWDYNLAFGSFNMGGGIRNIGGASTNLTAQGDTSAAGNAPSANPTSATADSATASVNFPIDSPVSGAAMEDRPLINQLLINPEYLARYHELFAEFITQCFDSGMFEELVTNAVELISPYIEKDPSKFCTFEEFTTAKDALVEFALLRAQSIKGQLIGEIASTTEAQAISKEGFIDASHVNISAMGSMGGIGNGALGGFNQRRNREAIAPA